MSTEFATTQEKEIKIYWTNAERDLMAQYVVELFEKDNVPVDDWKVTGRHLHRAQLDVIDLTRFRNTIRNEDIEDCQNRVDLISKLNRFESIIAKHFEYEKTWGQTPINHNLTLQLELKALGEKYETLYKAHEAILARTLPQQQPQQPQHKSQPLQQKIEEVSIKDTKAGLFVCAPYLSQQQKSSLEIQADIIWMTDKDDIRTVRSKTKKRHCIVQKGKINAPLARALRDYATSFVEFEGGFSKLESLIQQKSCHVG